MKLNHYHSHYVANQRSEQQIKTAINGCISSILALLEWRDKRMLARHSSNHEADLSSLNGETNHYKNQTVLTQTAVLVASIDHYGKLKLGLKKSSYILTINFRMR